MGINIKNQRIVVTGGTGFIGGYLVKKLLDNNNHVDVIDIKLNPKSFFALNKLNKTAKLHFIDIRNKLKIQQFIKKTRPDFIFHLAAQAIVEEAYSNPYDTLETNLMGTINLLESARLTSNLKTIIIASSDKAYGKKTGKYVETDQLKGDHPYEVSKSGADLISNSYFVTYNTPVIITRFGNVYGQGDLNFNRIIPGIMFSLIKDKTLLLRSDGSFVRDYIYVDDVINGYIKLAENYEKTIGNAYNFGSEETLSVVGLISVIENILQKKIKFKILNTAKNEIPVQSLDYSKITKHTGWKPRETLAVTIPLIYKYYQNII